MNSLNIYISRIQIKPIYESIFQTIMTFTNLFPDLADPNYPLEASDFLACFSKDQLPAVQQWIMELDYLTANSRPPIYQLPEFNTLWWPTEQGKKPLTYEFIHECPLKDWEPNTLIKCLAGFMDNNTKLKIAVYKHEEREPNIIYEIIKTDTINILYTSLEPVTKEIEISNL
jgi:hypothetical protein